MPGREKRWGRWLTIGVATLVLVGSGALIYATRHPSQGSLPERLVADLLYPFQAGASWVVEGVHGGAAGLSEIFSAARENRELRAEVEALKGLRLENERLARENEALKRQLGVSVEGYQTLGAEVIGRTPDSWFETIIIDRGSRDGVAVNMPVINNRGLVGRVVKVSDFSAAVRLLISADPDNVIGTMNTKNKEAGKLAGTSTGELEMEFFNRDAAVAVDDVIVTSGLGRTIPPGLAVGRVVAVGRHPNNLFPTAVIEPYVDFDQLDYLRVILAPEEDHFEAEIGP